MSKKYCIALMIMSEEQFIKLSWLEGYEDALNKKDASVCR